MDLVLLGVGVAILVVAAIGVLVVSVFAVGVWYGRWYWSGEERKWSGAWLQRGWRGGRAWPWIKWLLRYEATATGIPWRPSILACQPHGMFALSAAVAVFSGDFDDNKEAEARTVLVVHDWYWWVPGLRELMLMLGCIDKRWSSIQHALEQGYHVAVLPGGVFEMGPPAVPPPPMLGIVRRAHAWGRAPLVPVFLHGEQDVCWVWHTEPQWLRRLRAWTLKTWGVGVGALCVPRVWAWPRLKPLVGPALDPRRCPTPAMLQFVYDKVRADLQENRPEDAALWAEALGELPARSLPSPVSPTVNDQHGHDNNNNNTTNVGGGFFNSFWNPDTRH